MSCSVASAADTAPEPEHRRVGLGERRVDSRDDVVGVLQLLVVLEHDELVALDGGAGLAGGVPPPSSPPPVPEEPDSPQAAVNSTGVPEER